MKPRYAWLVAGFCALCSGCEILQLAACNLAYEAWLEKEYVASCTRYRKLAVQGWRESLCSNPGQVHSLDYDQGFKDGFASCLQAGGYVLMPMLPPRHYWSTRFQTPEGHRAINDWYLGYQHGAQAARACGLREFITLPALGPAAAPVTAPPVGEPLPEAPSFSGGLPVPRPVSVFPMTVPSPVPPAPVSGILIQDQ